jgi:hypothetical protein
MLPDESIFGVETLDCREYATTMLSTTKSREIATRFGELRNLSRDDLRLATFAGSRSMSCNLSYPVPMMPKDGPVFRAAQMEDKWDIYLYEGHLYFCRSWTGQLIYRARIESAQGNTRVNRIDFSPEGENPDPAEQVHFLIGNHLLGLNAPHPLPRTMGKDPRELALWSFTQYGRRGLYGVTSPMVSR